jgi:hypothetical protein
MSSNDTRRSFLEALVSTVTGFVFAGTMLLTGAAAEASKPSTHKHKPPVFTPKYGIKPQPAVKYGIKPAPVQPKYGIKPKPNKPVKPSMKYGGPSFTSYGL